MPEPALVPCTCFYTRMDDPDRFSTRQLHQFHSAARPRKALEGKWETKSLNRLSYTLHHTEKPFLDAACRISHVIWSNSNPSAPAAQGRFFWAGLESNIHHFHPQRFLPPTSPATPLPARTPPAITVISLIFSRSGQNLDASVGVYNLLKQPNFVPSTRSTSKAREKSRQDGILPLQLTTGSLVLRHVCTKSLNCR